MHHIRLTDIYTHDALNDEGEALYHHISDDYEDAEFAVMDVPHAEISALLTPLGDMSVIDAFADLADAEAKDIVRAKMQDFDADRIIAVCQGRVIDGNHHVVAAWQAGRDLRAIDLAVPRVPEAELDLAGYAP